MLLTTYRWWLALGLFCMQIRCLLFQKGIYHIAWELEMLKAAGSPLMLQCQVTNWKAGRLGTEGHKFFCEKNKVCKD